MAVGHGAAPRGGAGAVKAFRTNEGTKMTVNYLGALFPEHPGDIHFIKILHTEPNLPSRGKGCETGKQFLERGFEDD